LKAHRTLGTLPALPLCVPSWSRTLRHFLLWIIWLSFPNALHSRTLADDKERQVSLYVSVLDKQGTPVTDLAKTDVEVFEGKKPQTVISLEFERSTPISLGVLIDVSKSMGGERINLALSWLKILAERLKSPDELFVNAFSDESQEVIDYVSPEDYLEEALDHLGTGGQVRMGLALDLALIKLREARNQKRAILLFSAGRDIAGPATLDHISRFGYPIYAIGIAGDHGVGSTFDRLKNLNLKGSPLKVFAEHSGGEAIFVEASSAVEQALERLCLQMKNQYRLGYISNSGSKPGKMLKLELKTKNPDLEVRHPKKYQIISQR
jgi:Ca-activated chloride channel homolog